MADEKPIPDDEWATIVRNVPLVSVDLVVRTDGGVVLAKRRNEPAKGEWFVPGGVVRKHEEIEKAVHRVAREELGVSVTIDRRLGAYEHFYETADVEATDGKHYVAIGHVVTATGEIRVADDQHDAVEIFEPPFDGLDLHPYVAAYLADAGLLDQT